MSSEKAIKDAMKKGKLVIGKREVSRALKTGKLKAVFYAENCLPENVRELEYYGKASDVPVEKFSGTSSALGQSCGKPFKIVTLGIEK
jgi:large subunit ribosomal protein L30e